MMRHRIIVLICGGFALAALSAAGALVALGADVAPKGTVPLVCAAAVVAANIAITAYWAPDARAMGATFAFWQRNQ
jgi:hypothetical protein